MLTLRDYQQAALGRVRELSAAGVRSVCLVAPTGAGKTRMAVAWLTGHTGLAGAPLLHGDTGLWIVHRLELLRQSADQLAEILGPLDVGIIAPGADSRPRARVQVATVQTLLARGDRPVASRLVLDEAHHFVADQWCSLSDAYPNTLTLGLTATPERQDGRPLGDIFEELVVAARYPDLVRDGFLVACRAYAPPSEIEDGLALHPLEAYRRHGDGGLAFVFVGRTAVADELAAEFTAAGIPARSVHQGTRKRDRIDTLDDFARGRIQVLTSVNALTEGVDVPAARVAILARGFRHVGSYLQAAGRILRPHRGKPDAILIDLVGATFRHGLPIEDRVYSLDGEPIRRSGPSLRQCPACGFVIASAPERCPQCGHVFAATEQAAPRIYSLELRQVYAGQATPETAKRREWARLRALCDGRGWALDWAVRQYQKLFPGELPEITEEDRFQLYRGLVDRGVERGWKPAAAAVRFKQMFGAYPPWKWTKSWDAQRST